MIRDKRGTRMNRRQYHWLAVGLIVLLGSISFANVDVIYTDMIEAYEQGQLELARNLADKYIDMFNNELVATNNDPDREGSMMRLLGVIRSALQSENYLEASTRLANDQALQDKVEQSLLTCRDKYAELQPFEQSQKAYIQREVGMTAMEFIKVREELSSRSALQKTYSDFQTEIELNNVESVDAILNRPPFPNNAVETPKLSLDTDETDIMYALARDYFDSFVTGDVAKIARVTGATSSRSNDLLQKYAADCQQAGVQSITGFTLPEPTESSLVVTGIDRENGQFSVSLRGIQLQIIGPDGKEVTRTINKLMRFNRDNAGNWTVILPND